MMHGAYNVKKYCLLNAKWKLHASVALTSKRPAILCHTVYTFGQQTVHIIHMTLFVMVTKICVG